MSIPKWTVCSRTQMLENMVNEFRDLSTRMTRPERQMFDGTLVQSIAEQGKEVMHCATLLFLGMVG